MFFILISLIFLLIVSNFLVKFKIGSGIVFLLTLAILYFVFLFIQYTPDKEYYTWWIAFPEFSVDKEPTFQIVAAFIRKNHYDYQFFHITFLSIYCTLLLVLISKFNKNVLLITILYIPLIFIFFGTQLRYFLGYYAVLLGFYHLMITKKRTIAIVYFAFGICSHYSLILFIPFYFLLKIKTNFFQKIIRITLIVLLGYALLTTIVFKLLSGIRFLSYLEGDLVSSISGGIFTFAPIVPVYFLVQYYYKKRIALDPSLEKDLKFDFLYKMSVIPFVFIGIALTAQVVGHRLIMTGTLFPILLFFYKYNLISNMRFKVAATLVFLLYYIVIFIHFNFSTGLFLGEWESVEEVSKMLQSNDLIKDFF